MGHGNFLGEERILKNLVSFFFSLLSPPDLNDGKLTKSQATTLHRKKWLYHQGKILTTDQKEVIPKSQLYDILTLAHQRTAHRGRQITSKWINENYSEVNVRVVNLFVSMCQIHQEQKTITSHVKLVTKPL